MAPRLEPVFLTPWHPADIMSAIKKKGATLSSLAIAAGVQKQVVSTAMYRPYARGERIIADFLGIHPSVIWPDRYSLAGTPMPRARANKDTAA
ncbi:MAG: helix-turn-helix domain-containing protein [Hyphomicrobiales bacterium]|nr:helix-turn-helix domain-containing protein [Hyphomicrobiales bacterium]MDE2113862.1 helix-turn-helix domain-containing protein [Hyphomicrobiales bacterium]